MRILLKVNCIIHPFKKKRKHLRLLNILVICQRSPFISMSMLEMYSPMIAKKTDIITRLKMDILPLEGLRSILPGETLDLGLGFMEDAFPHRSFPLGAVHEFVSEGPESAASTAGFISALLASLMKNGAVAVWIGSSKTIFPPALKMFGIHPERVVFIDLLKERDVLWAMEEALKCNGLAAVICEMPELSFTASRRFQLAVEQSRVTGFILRSNPRYLNTNATVSRWKIKPLPTESYDELPGLGFPRWNVELLKIRNGKPGVWQLEWADQRLRHIPEFIPSIILEPKRKTG
jgi:protein ImuA